MQGRVKNTENLRTCSIVGCVKIDPKFHFLQKFPVFPCFFMILAVLIVSWAQVFHKPKVKDSLHRQEYKTSHGNPTGCFFAPESGDFYWQRYQCMFAITPNPAKIPLTASLPKTDEAIT